MDEFDDAHIFLRRRRHRKADVDAPVRLLAGRRRIVGDGTRLSVATARKDRLLRLVLQLVEVRAHFCHHAPCIDGAFRGKLPIRRKHAIVDRRVVCVSFNENRLDCPRIRF